MNFLDLTNFNQFEEFRRCPIRKKKSNSVDASKNDVGRNLDGSMRNNMGKSRILSADATKDNVGKSRIFYDLLRTLQYLNGNHKEKKQLPKMSNEAQNVLSSLHPNSTSKQNGEPRCGLKEPKRTLRKSWSTSMLWKGNKVQSRSPNQNRRNESGFRKNVREFSPDNRNNFREFSPEYRNNFRDFSPEHRKNFPEFSPESRNNVREFSPGYRNNSHCNSLPREFQKQHKIC